MKRKNNKTKMSPYLQHYLALKTDHKNRHFLPSLEKLKQEYINYLLERTGYRINKTAEILHISQTSLQNKLGKYGLRGNQSRHQ